MTASSTPTQTQSSTASIAQTTGAATATTTSSVSTNVTNNGPDFTKDPAELYRACPINLNAYSFPFSSRFNPQNSAAYLGGRDIQFYKLPNMSTGVMFISTFSLKGACQQRFYLDAILGLQNLTAAGVKHLLIDTSNNGGGSVVLNQGLQRLLTGEKLLYQNNFQSVLRRSPLSDALITAHLAQPNDTGSYYSADTYRNGTQNLNATEDIFLPGSSRQINGKTLYTSDLLQDTVDYIQEVDIANNVSNMSAFSPQDIVFTGNGLCGSACASFTNFLIEWYNATAYVAAARPSLPLSFQAFAAGEAVTDSGIYEDAQSIGFNNETLLPTRRVRGTFGFALRADISPNISPGEFLQYRPFPAQNRFALTPETYSSPLVQWQYVASQVFGSD